MTELKISGNPTTAELGKRAREADAVAGRPTTADKAKQCRVKVTLASK